MSASLLWLPLAALSFGAAILLLVGPIATVVALIVATIVVVTLAKSVGRNAAILGGLLLVGFWLALHYSQPPTVPAPKVTTTTRPVALVAAPDALDRAIAAPARVAAAQARIDAAERAGAAAKAEAAQRKAFAALAEAQRLRAYKAAMDAYNEAEARRAADAAAWHEQQRLAAADREARIVAAERAEQAARWAEYVWRSTNYGRDGITPASSIVLIRQQANESRIAANAARRAAQ